MKPSPLIAVRIITTVITSAVWWVILFIAGWLFSGAGKVDFVTPQVMANLTAASYVFVPYFVTEGALVSMLGTYLKQRIIMPPVTEDPKARPSNPWLWGALHAALFGVLAAWFGYMVCKGAQPDTLTPSAFGVRYAWGGTALCAIVAFIVSGPVFLRQVRVPAQNRPFAGGLNKYLWTRFILPHGIANFVINGLLAFALAPAGFAFADPAARVPNEVVIGDGVIALAVLTWIIASGAKGLARSDAEWGIAPHDFRADLHMPAAFLPCFFSGIGFCIVLGIAFAWFDVEGLSIYQWAWLRAIGFGVYCGWCAKRCARASINEYFHPEVIVHTRPPKDAPTAPAVAAASPEPVAAVSSS
ncbi:MAG TPA: hypothetical protein VJR89_06275 [Polyangiales bacterium]|nr:hypothetical protein [Polyangiales bacterium]